MKLTDEIEIFTRAQCKCNKYDVLHLQMVNLIRLFCILTLMIYNYMIPFISQNINRKKSPRSQVKRSR